MRILLLIVLITPLFYLINEPVYSQNDQVEEISRNDDIEVVRRVRFSGNQHVSDRALSTLVRTRTNREFLAIPRLTPWYYIWRVFGVGESPSELSRETVNTDINRISLFYENLGFFDVEVNASVIEYRENRFEVTFIINEGVQSYINTISYTGLPPFNSYLEL